MAFRVFADKSVPTSSAVLSPLPWRLTVKSSYSSSSFSYPFTYNVFLSFRDPDTPHGFLVHLFKFLHHKGIVTFIHEEEKAADLSGNDFKHGNEYECVFVEKIVKWVSNIVGSVTCLGSPGWTRVSRAKSFLDSEQRILHGGDLRNGWNWQNNTCSSSL